MLVTNDIGALFQSMRTAYGPQWKYGADAIPVWLAALKHFSQADVRKAANEAITHFVDYPPSLPQFLDVIRDTTPKLTGPDQENAHLVDRVYAYTKPEGKRNPNGNPHRITLPESVAAKKMGESPEQYEKRVSEAVTFAMYPKLGPDGRSRGFY